MDGVWTEATVRVVAPAVRMAENLDVFVVVYMNRVTFGQRLLGKKADIVALLRMKTLPAVTSKIVSGVAKCVVPAVKAVATVFVVQMEKPAVEPAVVVQMKRVMGAELAVPIPALKNVTPTNA